MKKHLIFLFLAYFINVGMSYGKVVFSEDWETGTIDIEKWELQGSPLPVISNIGDSSNYSVNNNGDASYWSWIASKKTFNLSQGDISISARLKHAPVREVHHMRSWFGLATAGGSNFFQFAGAHTGADFNTNVNGDTEYDHSRFIIHGYDSTSLEVDDQDWHDYKIELDTNGYARIYFDGQLMIEGQSDIDTTLDYQFAWGGKAVWDPVLIDNIVIEQGLSRKILTYVPPYQIQQVIDTLTADFDGCGVKNGITHLSLQFWIPYGGQLERAVTGTEKVSANGEEIKVTDEFGKISNEFIRWFIEWAGDEVKVLMNIYNDDSQLHDEIDLSQIGGKIYDWNWELAKWSFEDNREQFVQSIAQELDDLQEDGIELDGVEIDIEGPSVGESEHASFSLFLNQLSTEINGRHKELFCATWADEWNTPRNAPNPGWWEEPEGWGIMDFTQGVNAMAYESGSPLPDESFFDCSQDTYYLHYECLIAKTSNPKQLMIGMRHDPENLDPGVDFLKQSVMHQVMWVLKNSDAGIAIWHAELKNPKWKSRRLWQALARANGNTCGNPIPETLTMPLFLPFIAN